MYYATTGTCSLRLDFDREPVLCVYFGDGIMNEGVVFHTGDFRLWINNFVRSTRVYQLPFYISSTDL